MPTPNPSRLREGDKNIAAIGEPLLGRMSKSIGIKQISMISAKYPKWRISKIINQLDIHQYNLPKIFAQNRS